MRTKYYRSIDQLFFALTIFLIGIGFVIQYSASSSLAAAKFNDPGYYMRGHFIRIIIGLMVGLFFLKVNYNHLKNMAFWFVIISIILLIVTLIVHLKSDSTSAARWLSIGPFRFQPSEVAKFSIILYLASFYDRHQDDINDLKRGFLPPVAILTLIVILVVIEPDFSTGAVIAVLAITLMIIGGTKLIYLSPFAGLFAIFSIFTIIHSPYKLKRILTSIGGRVPVIRFINP